MEPVGKKVGTLQERFYVNIYAKEGVTREELERIWRYAGGDRGSHYNYFRLVYRGRGVAPEHAEYCFCETKIKENCYISNGERILPIGNCCIKRFMPEGMRGRTCERCDAPHRNRIVNRCNDCRRGLCDRCDVVIPKNKKVCDTCRFGYDECKYCEAETRWEVDVCDACKLLNHCKQCECVIEQGAKYCAECKDPRCEKCNAQMARGPKPRICGTCLYGHDECYLCKAETPHGVVTCDECLCGRVCRQCKAWVPGNRLKTIDLCDTCRLGHAKCKYCNAETPHGVVVCTPCSQKKRCANCMEVIDPRYTLCYKCKFGNACKGCGRPIAVQYFYCYKCNPRATTPTYMEQLTRAIKRYK